MRVAASVSLALASVFILGACGEGAENDGRSGKKKKKDGAGEEVALVGAPGVTIHEIAIYQGLKRSLEIDGVPQPASVPLVAGRDAIVRMFYSTDAAYDGGEVVGSLAIEGGEPLQVAGLLRTTPSVEEDLGSTFNLFVTGDRIGESFTYSAGLLRDVEVDNPAAYYPALGLETVPVEGKANTLRVTLVPFRYDSDGLGRLPDTSPESVEKYRTRFKQLYPVSNVEVTVREATPWNAPIGPDGSGWDEVTYRLATIREKDNVPDEVYYYGVFNPNNNAYQYCGSGCLLGLTLLNDDPSDVGEVDLRMALGVGFPEFFYDTAVHEIGHAHGRQHAPCGPGLDKNSIDHDYPYDHGKTGVWGLDPATQTLMSPDHTDIMSYCENNWISDYNYRALFGRGQAVNLPKWHAPMARKRMEVVTVDGVGRARWQGTQQVGHAGSGRKLAATFVDDTGGRSKVEGRFLAYDHLPGGWVYLPEAPARAQRVEIDLDAKRFVADR